MSNIFAAGIALTTMAQPSTYKRAYKKFGTKKTKGMLHAMQRHATAINPSNRNMFKEALAYNSQRSTPKQSIGQTSGLAIRQKAPTRSITRSKPRSRGRAQARSKRRSFAK